MIRLLSLLTGVLLASSSFAQGTYAVENIPKELLSYANTVVRTDETVVTIKDKGDAVYHYKIAKTILNSAGDEHASLTIYHSKLWTIQSVKGAIYNELGKQIAKVNESAFEDASVDDGFSLFQDAKYKHYTPGGMQYPYTVEYEYELHSKQTLDIPSWYTITSTNESVQSSSILLLAKPSLDITFKQSNYPGTVTPVDAEGMKSWYWHISNLKAMRPEAYSLSLNHFTTHVDFAARDFLYDGITGSYTDWHDLGKWTYDNLLKGRDKVSPATTQAIRDLVKNETSDKDKAKKIYEYMQAKSRYVSIQIGIGGFRPFTAEEVDGLGYGDCKALVNYTHALLKAVNIESYYCVVEAGNRKISMIPDFASMAQGNHVILCLPFKNDTTWVECTSMKIPFGFLGTFTDDRTVLACTPDGGRLMHTASYTAMQNHEDRVAELSLSGNGAITGVMKTNFYGTQYDSREQFLSESEKNKLKFIVKEYPINNMEVDKLSFEADKKILPVLKEEITFKAADYGTVTDGKIVFTANAANRVNNLVPLSKARVSPLYINRGFADDEKIIYTIPEGYVMENPALDVDLNKKWGKYRAEINVTGNRITYTRKIKIDQGTYSKEDYNDFVDFNQSIFDADRFVVKLSKK